MHAAPEDLPEDTGTDEWSIHLPGQELVPAYLVSRFAAQYRVLVDVLLAAQDTSLTGMSFEQITASVQSHLSQRLPAGTVTTLVRESNFPLDARLAQLERWEVVTRWQEPARTGEDFLRRRDRYQLTPTAARLHAFWTQEETTDEEEAADLTLAPRVIHDRVTEFRDRLAENRYPQAAGAFQQIVVLHQGMARSARTWQRTLAHALSGGPNQEKQELLWTTLRAYVGMWGEQVDIYSPQIATLVADIDRRLTSEMWRACVRGALASDVTAEIVEAQAVRWAQVWGALGSWFTGPNSQARRLRRQLRDLVPSWARNMRILIDTGGAVTRRAELLRLATAVERAPDDEAAWRIWDTATGAFAARHLLLPADAPDDDRSWSDAPSAPVEARYRQQGTRSAVGRRVNTPDYGRGRQAARGVRLKAVAARHEAEANLRQRSGSRLSEWGVLSDAELDLLVELLGVARRSTTAEGGRASTPRTGTTSDGRWRVILTPPSDRRTTTVTSPRGNLASVDWQFDLEPL